MDFIFVEFEPQCFMTKISHIYSDDKLLFGYHSSNEQLYSRSTLQIMRDLPIVSLIWDYIFGCGYDAHQRVQLAYLSKLISMDLARRRSLWNVDTDHRALYDLSLADDKF